MKYSFILLSALALSLAALTGCSGHAATASVASIEASKPVQIDPVLIMPNCKILGGKTFCQWLVPRGYQHASPTPTPAPAAASTQRVPGIAL